MSLVTAAFDVACYLDGPEISAAYMAEALETCDPRLIAIALGAIARAKSETQIAEDAGLSMCHPPLNLVLPNGHTISLLNNRDDA